MYHLDINNSRRQIYLRTDSRALTSIDSTRRLHMVLPDDNALRTSEKIESKSKRERERAQASWRYARAMIINVCSFVHEHIERRAAERISHSVRCEPQPHRGPIFFFLVDFVCGRVRLPAPKRHSVSFLFLPSMTTKSFSSSSFFPFLHLAFSLSLSCFLLSLERKTPHPLPPNLRSIALYLCSI